MKPLLACLALLLVAACGGENDAPGAGGGGAPDEDRTSSPACTDIWVAGQTLPEGYEGCTRPDGDLEAAVSYECTDGGDLVGYDDRFYVVTPGKIAEISGEDDPSYAAAYDACLAD